MHYREGVLQSKRLSWLLTWQSYLVRQRDDKVYDSFYSSTVDQAKEYTGDPVLPRYKKIP